MKNLETIGGDTFKEEIGQSEEAAWERAVSFVNSFKQCDVFSEWVKINFDETKINEE